MDERGVYEGSDTSQVVPTTTEPGPAGGGAVPGTDTGGLKREPVSSSPTIGHTIAGRNLGGEPVREEESEEPGAGIRTGERAHLDHE